jgi:UDPglucose 6-dehydrogenase
MQIAVVGSGYVGLVTGTCLAEVGHHVTCVDLDEQKINALKSGISPIYEPGLDDLIQRNVEHERLTFTTSLEQTLKADAAGDSGISVLFIAVGTPEGEDGSSDLRYVHAVARDVARWMQKSLMVIVKSTVPVGTCDQVEAIIREGLEKRGVKLDFVVASNPEFLKEGAAIEDFMRPDRIVVGLRGKVHTRENEEVFRELYRPFVTDDPGRLLFMERRSSELTKYGANAMLATRISFMNELAQLCAALGANIDDVRIGIGADPRIGRKFLYAGPGYGGSCFPKDVEALRATGRKSGCELAVLNAVGDANDRHKSWVAKKILRHFGSLKGKHVAVWGLAFKPGTDDVREAPALTLIDFLLQEGATVTGHDPEARETFARAMGERSGLSFAADSYSALKGADALVLVTEWTEYKRPNWDKVFGLMRGKAIFDFRNQYNFKTLAAHGAHYECVGRPDSTSKGELV